MSIYNRLSRKPVSTILWILLVMVMTGFLTVGGVLMFSTQKLAASLDKSHTAIAVRTDPARSGDWKITEDYEKTHTFTNEDKAYFEAMPSVKAVRNNTLSAASCEQFYPIVDLDKYNGWTSKGTISPYAYIALYGNVIKTVKNDNELAVGISIEDILYISPALEEAEQVLRYIGMLAVVMDTPEENDAIKQYFEKGETYLFIGYFNPLMRSEDYNWAIDSSSQVTYYMHLGEVWMKDDMMFGDILNTADDELKAADKLHAYCFPAAIKLENAPESLFERDKNLKKFKEVWKKQMHSLPVIGTERLEAMYTFMKGETTISEGRSFTDEEYENGEKVAVLSERIAALGGIKVGDKLKLSQYHSQGDGEHDTNLSLIQSYGMLNNPCIDMLNMDTDYQDEEEFTVVGIYKMSEEWTYGAYAITPNTVFIPKKAQIAGAFGEIGETDELYGIYLALELKNGSVDDFRLQASSAKYLGQFYAFDQGYETVQKSVNTLAASIVRLVVVSAIGWVLFLLLFLAMYQASQKRNMGVMRSLGNLPRQTAAYLFFSGLLVVVIGVLLAMAAGFVIIKSMQQKLLGDALSGIDYSAFSGKPAISEERMSELVRSSIPGLKTVGAFAAVQLGLISVPMLIQAIVISKKNPRDLIRG